MPKNLRGKPVSRCYKIASTLIFFIGLIANIIFPAGYALFAWKSNSGNFLDPPDPEYTFDKYHNPYIATKFMVGILQVISACFMLYAIVAIWYILKNEITMAEFFS